MTNEPAGASDAELVAQSPDAIIFADLDGVIRTWNAAAERIFGFAPDAHSFTSVVISASTHTSFVVAVITKVPANSCGCI